VNNLKTPGFYIYCAISHHRHDSSCPCRRCEIHVSYYG